MLGGAHFRDEFSSSFIYVDDKLFNDKDNRENYIDVYNLRFVVGKVGILGEGGTLF